MTHNDRHKAFRLRSVALLLRSGELQRELDREGIPPLRDPAETIRRIELLADKIEGRA